MHFTDLTIDVCTSLSHFGQIAKVCNPENTTNIIMTSYYGDGYEELDVLIDVLVNHVKIVEITDL